MEEVKREMQSAINETYTNPQINDVTKAFQDRIPRKGELPTVDEFIRYMADKAKKKQG